MNETDVLKKWLDGLSVDEPLTFERLSVYPVRCAEPAALDLLTLGEVLKGGCFRIGETGAGGTVPELLLVNDTDCRVFLMDGEELVGAKQNRILNTSVLVEKWARVKIPVSCVERGRWHYEAEATMRPGSVSHPGLRGQKARQVHENLRARGCYDSDQSAVWDNVSEKLFSLKVDSPSDSLEEAFTRHGSALDEYVESLPCPGGGACFVGVAAAIGGRFVCADVFCTPGVLKRLWARLVASYALDAMDATGAPARPPGASAIAAVLHLPEGSTLEPFPSPGLGASVRLSAPRAAGSALVAEGAVVHLQLFPAGDGDGEGGTRITRPSRRSSWRV